MIRNSSSKESVFSRLDAVMLIAARHAEGVCFVMVIAFARSVDLFTSSRVENNGGFVWVSHT